MHVLDPHTALSLGNPIMLLEVLIMKVYTLDLHPSVLASNSRSCNLKDLDSHLVIHFTEHLLPSGRLNALAVARSSSLVLQAWWSCNSIFGRKDEVGGLRFVGLGTERETWKKSVCAAKDRYCFIDETRWRQDMGNWLHRIKGPSRTFDPLHKPHASL